MILLALVAVWFLLLLMVASLCMAAQVGDRQRLEVEPPQERDVLHAAVPSARSAGTYGASSQPASALARTAA
jgi:hypothetical protein